MEININSETETWYTMVFFISESLEHMVIAKSIPTQLHDHMIKIIQELNFYKETLLSLDTKSFFKLFFNTIRDDFAHLARKSNIKVVNGIITIDLKRDINHCLPRWVRKSHIFKRLLKRTRKMMSEDKRIVLTDLYHLLLLRAIRYLLSTDLNEFLARLPVDEKERAKKLMQNLNSKIHAELNKRRIKFKDLKSVSDKLAHASFSDKKWDTSDINFELISKSNFIESILKSIKKI